jgi:hypothetical protein
MGSAPPEIVYSGYVLVLRRTRAGPVWNRADAASQHFGLREVLSIQLTARCDFHRMRRIAECIQTCVLQEMMRDGTSVESTNGVRC